MRAACQCGLTTARLSGPLPPARHPCRHEEHGCQAAARATSCLSAAPLTTVCNQRRCATWCGASASDLHWWQSHDLIATSWRSVAGSQAAVTCLALHSKPHKGARSVSTTCSLYKRVHCDCAMALCTQHAWYGIADVPHDCRNVRRLPPRRTTRQDGRPRRAHRTTTSSSYHTPHLCVTTCRRRPPPAGTECPRGPAPGHAPCPRR